MTRMAIGIALVLQVVGASSASRRSTEQGRSEPLRLLPTDEANSEPALSSVRAAMLDAVNKHDIDALARNLEPAGWEAFGGIENVRATLGGPTELWDEFKYVLTHGGAFTTTRGRVRGRREFCAPYVYGAYPNLPDEALDPSFPWAITGRNVRVRARPMATAPVIRRLSYDLVQSDGYVGGDASWAVVSLANGRQGYVARAYIRSPTDYHACFAHVSGRWMLVELDRDREPERDR